MTIRASTFSRSQHLRRFGGLLRLVTLALLLISSASFAHAASDKELYDKNWEEGEAFSEQGKWDQAVVSFSNAIKYFPKLPANYGSYVNRGNAYSMLGKLDLALADYMKALDAFPDKAAKELGEVYYNRGAAYHKNGKPELAIPDYEKAIAIDSEIKSVHNKLAWLLATCPNDKIRDGKKAVKHALIACKQDDNKDPNHLDTLAAAFAEAVDFANAVTTMKLAISLNKDAEALVEFKQRLALYEEKKPYRKAK